MNNAMYDLGNPKKSFFSLLCFLVLGDVLSAIKDGEHSQNKQFRIVGGRSADISEYPFQVAILEKGELLCGGSILNQKLILTAAHCTWRVPPSAFEVRVGSSKWNESGLLLDVVRKYEHPLYESENFINDVAILELETPLVYTDVIQPVSLPDAEASLPDIDTMATVSGWGKTNYDEKRMSNHLMATDVPLISTKSCKISYLTYKVTESMFCAGYLEGGKDACTGDSGGPLTIDGIQYGIVSWGRYCADYDSPGVYSSVIFLRNFISEIVNTIPK